MNSNQGRRVLVFSLAYFPLTGGAEIAVRQISNRLDKFEFDLIAAKLDKKFSDFEKIDRINVYRVGTGSNFDKYLYPILALFKAGELARANKYSLIWAMMASAGLAALFFKLLNKQIPYLLTTQEGDSEKVIMRRFKWIYPLYKQIFIRADGVQAISRYLAERAKRLGFKGSVNIIPNGVNLDMFRPIDNIHLLHSLKKDLGIKDFEKVIITVSRLVKKNGIRDLVRAVSLLNTDYKLIIIGKGDKDKGIDDEKDIKKQVKDLNLVDNVIFLGQVDYDDLPKYLNVSDVFVRPSLSEGLGNVFLEAMACGVPVIGTPIGGILDFLRHGETGLFCKVKDPKNLANVLKNALQNNDLRKRLRENGLKLVREKYDWTKISQDMENLFNSLER